MGRVRLSGNEGIDGLLWGVKWPAATLLYGFPTDPAQYSGYPADAFTGFEAFSATQQAAVRGIAADVNGLILLALTESADPAAADISFAEAERVDQDGGGSPGEIGTAVGTPPDPATAPSYAWGDCFFAPGRCENPVPGSYDHMTMMHELGHALGLKHGHVRQLSADGAFYFPALPLGSDSMEFSVMTYRSSVGGPADRGFTNESWGYAQSFMMLDIAALQYLYGANYATNSGDTVYSWRPDTGETFIDGVGQGKPGANRIFLTIWDGGGVDTYDFSAYSSGLSIDLLPGHWSVTRQGQLAILDSNSGLKAGGNVYNALLHDGDLRSIIENARGGSGSDRMFGNAAANDLRGNDGNDRITGFGGGDLIEGGGGHDRLTGGGAADAFVYREIKRDSADRITDFGAKDRLWFAMSGFGAWGDAADGTGRLGSGHFVSGAGASAQDRDDVFLYDTATHELRYDADGNGAGAAVLIARFSNGAAIHAGDLSIFL